MSLKDQFESDLRDSMRARDELRRDTLRLAISALKYARITAQHDLDAGEELGVIGREVKQRRESIVEFEKGGRADLAAREQAELAILAAYLPEQVSTETIIERARAIIAETGASGPRDMGKVMPRLTAELKGQADGREMSRIVQELLAGNA